MLLSPETRERLHGIREGVWRVEHEGLASAAHRHRELKRVYTHTVLTDPRSYRIPGFEMKLALGPSIRRSIVLFDGALGKWNILPSIRRTGRK